MITMREASSISCGINCLNVAKSLAEGQERRFAHVHFQSGWSELESRWIADSALYSSNRTRTIYSIPVHTHTVLPTQQKHGQNMFTYIMI